MARLSNVAHKWTPSMDSCLSDDYISYPEKI